MQRVVDLACDFLQIGSKFYLEEKRPKVIGLKDGDTFQSEGISVRAAAARHPVAALSYRVEDQSGVALAASGDTAYNPNTQALFSGCKALIHDSTLGVDVNLEPPENRKNGHSNLLEAVQCAAACEIPLLFPVHMSKTLAMQSLKEMNHVQNVNIVLPQCGKTYLL